MEHSSTCTRQRFLSTLSLRRATAWRLFSVTGMSYFYPRSPCGERRSLRYFMQTGPPYFYPRSPCGERLLTEINKMATGQISIHALLAESDPKRQCTLYGRVHFYPRSPCGERLMEHLDCKHTKGISIHALLAESDTSILHKILADWDFYPRSPCGERQGKSPSRCCACHFYPRSPCGERRYLCMYVHNLAHISIHALLAESDILQTPLSG